MALSEEQLKAARDALANLIRPGEDPPSDQSIADAGTVAIELFCDLVGSASRIAVALESIAGSLRALAAQHGAQ
jgi:hypothetical protein